MSSVKILLHNHPTLWSEILSCKLFNNCKLRKIRWLQKSEKLVHLPPPFLFHKNGERSRKASLHCAVRLNFASSRGKAALHRTPEALLACPAIASATADEGVPGSISLVKRSAALPVKLLPAGVRMAGINNEAARLLFTVPSGSTSHLHAANPLFTELRKPCLLVPP